MNFTYDGADLSKIIKRYKKSQNEYLIEYLDGSFNRYISYKPDEEERIKKEMLEQAKQRTELYDTIFLNFTDKAYFIGSLISISGLGFSFIKDEKDFKFFWIIAIMISLNKFIKNGKKMKELEKYKLFLELIEELGEEELNSPEYTKCYECDNLYAKKLDIGSLDSFEYEDIKRIYEKYKSKVK
jgi:hypothetical protein